LAEENQKNLQGSNSEASTARPLKIHPASVSFDQDCVTSRAGLFCLPCPRIVPLSVSRMNGFGVLEKVMPAVGAPRHPAGCPAPPLGCEPQRVIRTQRHFFVPPPWLRPPVEAFVLSPRSVERCGFFPGVCVGLGCGGWSPVKEVVLPGRPIPIAPSIFFEPASLPAVLIYFDLIEIARLFSRLKFRPGLVPRHHRSRNRLARRLFFSPASPMTFVRWPKTSGGRLPF